MVTTYTERGPALTGAYAERGPALTGAIRRVSWGAIFAGTAMVLAIQLMLGLLGLGIGLATIDPVQNDTPSIATLTSTGGIWAIVTVLIATFVGAYVAARLAGSPSNTDGLLHGIVTWAFSTLIAVWLLTSGASAIVSGAFGALGSSVQGISSAAQALTPNSLSVLPDNLERQARELLNKGGQQAQQAANQAQQQGQQAAQNAQQATGQQDLGAAMKDILAGVQQDATPEEHQAAVQMISQEAGIPQQEAEQRLQKFQQAYNDATAKAEQAAQETAKTVSATAFGTFVALVLGLIVGAIGGRVGRPSHTVEADAYS